MIESNPTEESIPGGPVVPSTPADVVRSHYPLATTSPIIQPLPSDSTITEEMAPTGSVPPESPTYPGARATENPAAGAETAPSVASGVSGQGGSGLGLTGEDATELCEGAFATFRKKGDPLRRALESFSFVSLWSMQHTVPKWLEDALFAIELLQILSFAVDPAFVSGSILEAVFAGISRIRNPLGSSFVLPLWIVFAALALSHAVQQVILLVLVSLGDTGRWSKFGVLAYRIFQMPLALPCGYLMLSPIISQQKSVALIVLGVFGFLIVAVMDCLTKAQLWPWRPSTSHLAIPFRVFVAMSSPLRWLMVLSDVFIKPGFGGVPPSTVATASIHAAVIILATLPIHAWILTAFPYYSMTVNIIASGNYTALIGGAFVGLISSVNVAPGWRMGCGIAILCTIAVFFAIGVVGGRLRFTHPHLYVLLSSKPEIPDASYNSAVGYVMAAKNLLTQRNTTSGMLDRADALFEEALVAFPTSVFLRAYFAVFLLDYKVDHPRLRVLLKSLFYRKTHQLSPPMRLLFYGIASCLKYTVLGGDDDVDLNAAEMQKSAAIAKLVHLWEMVSETRRTIDPEAFFSDVDALSRHEFIADKLFRRVLSKHSTSPIVMRQYASFLSDIRDEKERAEAFFQEADRLEEETVSGKKGKKRVSGTRGLRFNEAQQLPGAMPPSPKGEIMEIEGPEEPPLQSKSGTEGAGRPRALSNASSSIASSAAAMPEDRAKLLDYKERVLMRKSGTLGYSLAFIVTAVTLFGIAFIVAFVMTSNSLKDFKTEAYAVHYIMDVPKGINEALLQLRFGRFQNDFNMSRLVNSVIEARTAWIASLDYQSEEDLGTWGAQQVVISDFVRSVTNGTLGNATNSSVVMWDFVSSTLERLSDIAFMVAQSPTGDFKLDPKMRYLFDNAVAMTDATNCFTGPAGLSFVLLGIFIPLYRRISKERSDVAHTFAEIPKAATLNVLERVKSLDKKGMGQRHDLTKILARKGVSKMFSLTARFFCLAFFLVALTLTMALILFTGTLRTNGSDIATVEGEKQTSFVLLINGLLGSLYNSTHNDDLLTEQQIKERIVWAVGVVRESDDALDEYGLLTGDLMTLWNYRPCPPEVQRQINVTVVGLNALLAFYLDHVLEIASSASGYATHPARHFVEATHGTLIQWLEESESILFGRATKVIVNLSNSAIYVTIIAMLWGITLELLLSERTYSITSSTTRATNLLLMVPLNVLMAEDGLRNFLEQGAASAPATLKALADEQEKKTKLILEACDDAIVLTDSKGTVETVNPAAERLLGRSFDELLGVRFSSLLIHSSEKQFERALKGISIGTEEGTMKQGKVKKSFTIGDVNYTAVKHSDGGEIAVLVTTSLVSYSDSQESSLAIFVRDIRIIKERERELEIERSRADELLLNILPLSIAETLKKSPDTLIAKKYTDTTVMFADIVDFHKLKAGMHPIELVKMLNEVFSPWDTLATSDSGVEKIKSIGDCWMAVSGVPTERPDHAECMMNFVLCALEDVRRLNSRRASVGLLPVSFRVGIHSGSLVAGVIGFTKWAFDVWGDTVNVAARLETSSLPGKIQVSAVTMGLLKDKFKFESRGLISLKGKGDLEVFVLSEGQQSRRKLAPGGTTSSSIFHSAAQTPRAAVPSPKPSPDLSALSLT